MLVVTVALVRYLDEMESTVLVLKIDKTIKSGKMFKLSSNARFLRVQRRQNGLTPMLANVFRL